jgi:hypothetical protein
LERDYCLFRKTCTNNGKVRYLSNKREKCENENGQKENRKGADLVRSGTVGWIQIQFFGFGLLIPDPDPAF